MSTKFHHNIRRDNDVTWVTLGGVIDEDNELNTLGELDGQVVVIDVGAVERINSCGVRDWVNWLSPVGRRSQVVLVRCSPAIVAQINLVNNFAGHGLVKSFYIPYFCSECDQEKVMLSDATDLGPPPHQPPVCRCDECDLVMEFDDMADSYFAFLDHQPEVDLGALAAIIERGDDGSSSSERIRTGVPLPVQWVHPGTSGSTPNPSSVSLPSIPSLPTGSAISGLGSSTPSTPSSSASPSTPSSPSYPPMSATPSNAALARMRAESRQGANTAVVIALAVAAAVVLLLVYALTT